MTRNERVQELCSLGEANLEELRALYRKTLGIPPGADPQSTIRKSESHMIEEILNVEFPSGASRSYSEITDAEIKNANCVTAVDENGCPHELWGVGGRLAKPSSPAYTLLPLWFTIESSELQIAKTRVDAIKRPPPD